MFSLLGAPYYRRRPLRCGLLLAGVALAAAIHAGMRLGNASLSAAFEDTLNRVAGRAEIQISGAGGVPEDALERIRALHCTSEAAAMMLRIAPVELPGETALAVLGVDLLEDDRFRDYDVAGAQGFEDALTLLAQPDSVLITRALADRHALGVGSALPVWTGQSTRELIVRGVLDNSDLTEAYGGNLAVMDLYAAQLVFGRRGLFDRIDVQVEKGSRVEACQATIESELGGQFEVAATARGGGSRQAFSGTYSAVVDASTLLALLAALMLIHHASAVGVAQREREIAILLSLGAEDRRIRRFVLAEAAMAAAIAGALGVGMGFVAAEPFSQALGGLLHAAVGVSIAPSAVTVDPLWAAGTVLATAAVAAAGVWGAARAAEAVPPIQLAAGRRYSARVEAGNEAALPQAAVLAAAAVAVQRVWAATAALYVALPLAFAALWRLGRALDGRLFGLIRPLFTYTWPLAGALAIDSLLRERRRVRGPLLAIAFSVTLVVTISGVTGSYANRFLRWASDRIRMDYLIHSAGSLSDQGAFLPVETYEQLTAADGIAAVARVRRITGRAAGRRARLFAVDLETWARAAGVETPFQANSAVVAQNFASRAGLEAGDDFSIQTPTGLVTLRAEVILEDYISELGAIYFDWDLYEECFQTEAIEMIGVTLEPGADREAARERIAALLPEGAPALVVDATQISAHIESIVGRWRQASYLQSAAVAPIAILAAGSFLAVSLLGKRRQLAILEALGATPAEIRRCVWTEAMALGLAGSLLGLVGGVLLQLFVLDSIQQSLVGSDLPFELDWRLAVGLLAAGPTGAAVAAWLPMRALGRASLVRQLTDE